MDRRQGARASPPSRATSGRWCPPAPPCRSWTSTEGGIHALLRLELRQPTRFLYDFHFFHDEGDPRIQALRAELVAGLERGRPAAVVVLRDTLARAGL